MLPTTPAALAFANTLEPRNPVMRRPEAAQVLQHLAALTQLLTPWDLQALGIWSDAATRCGTRWVRAAAGSGLPDGQLTVHESPEGRHRAMMWSSGSAPCCQAWVDGQLLAVPQGADGQPLALLPGHWAGEDFFCLETLVDGQAAHDAADAAQHGLWVGQVSTGLHWQLHPAADEHWPSPWARWVAGTGLQVWADSRLEGAAPARELTL
jgi:hypothetical protein